MSGAGIPIPGPVTAADILRRLTGAATLAAGALLYGDGDATLATLAAPGAAGRVLISATGPAAPAWSDSGLSYASGVLAVAGSVPGTPTAGQVLVGGGQVKMGGVLSCQGIQNTVGDLTSRADEDAQTILGRIRCGFFTGLGDNASFAHYDHGSATNYALRQDAAGATALNAATGQSATIRVNNTIVLTVTASGITAAQPITVPNGTAAAPGLRLLDAVHGLWRAASTAIGIAVGGVDTARIYQPNGSTFGGALYLATPSATEGGLVFASAATSFVCYSGGSTVNVGGWMRAYGQSHASKANYVEFGRATSTVAAFFDGSGNLTCNGTITIPDGTAGSPGLRTTTEASGLYRASATSLGVSLAGVAAYRLWHDATNGAELQFNQGSGLSAGVFAGATTGYLYFSGSTGPASGGQIRVYGNTHASRASRVEFTRGATVSAFFDANGNFNISDAEDIVVGTTTGTRIGTATAQRLGFWGATPVVQPTAVADASGGSTIDAEARTALNALLARLRTIGVLAT